MNLCKIHGVWITILVLLMTRSHVGFSQEPNNEYAGFILTVEAGTDISLPTSAFLGNLVSPSFRVLPGYMMQNSLEFRVGLDFSRYQYQSEPGMIKEVVATGSQGQAVYEEFLVSRHSRDFVVSIPTEVGYHIKFGNWSLIPALGLQTGVLSNYSQYYEYIELGENGSTNSNSGFYFFSLYATGSVGLARSFNQAKLSLSVSSNSLLFVRGYGTSDNSDYRSLGINLGYHYRF